MGIGAVALAAGAVFGLLAVSTEKSARELCAPKCTEEAATKSSNAIVLANVANGAAIVGTIGAAVGVYFYVASRPSKVTLASSRTALKVAPQVGPQSAGLTMQGAW